MLIVDKTSYSVDELAALKKKLAVFGQNGRFGQVLLLFDKVVAFGKNCRFSKKVVLSGQTW